MDEVFIVSVGAFVRSAVVDFGEDDGGKGRGLRSCGGGMLSKNRSAVGDAGAVEYVSASERNAMHRK